MHHIPPSVDMLFTNFSQEIAGLSSGPWSSITGSWDRTELRYCFGTRRCRWDPEVVPGTWRSFWNMEAAPELEVVFRTCKVN
ncbi:hypothetical protein Bca101_059357 [Brassica carinata]